MFHNYRKSEFAKGVITLASGSSIAHLAAFLAEPVLSRLFTPAEFGIFEIYAAIVIIFGAIAGARYEMAIVLPKMDHAATNLLGLSVVLVVLFSVLCIGILLVTENFLIRYIGNPTFTQYLFYIPLGIFLIGINRSFLFWELRKKHMKAMSLSRISESTGRAVSSSVFGVLRLSSFGLILGQIVGQFVSTAFLVAQYFRFHQKNKIFLSGRRMLKLAGTYAEFPMLNVPLAISEMIQISGIIFIFSFFFNNTQIGEFGKALRIMLIPLNLVGTAITQAFYQKASKDLLKGVDISVQMIKIMKSLAWFVAPGLLLFLLISPWLFGLFLGKYWVTAGEYARILAIWIFVKFLILPVTTLPLIIHKQRPYFFINLIGNVLMIAAVMIPGLLKMGIYPTLYILSFSQALFLGFLYFRVMRIYRRHYTSTIK